MTSSDVPVVLVVFNRAAHTRRTLEAIRQAAPRQLFVLADGPRADRPEDVERCAEVRSLFDTIDWPCVVQRRFQTANLGLDQSIETGLDWVFSQVESAIVLEDDCLPHPDFFPFCAEVLDRYAADPEIWMVSGRAPHLSSEVFGTDSYAFMAVGAIWGWATWRRAWQRHRALSSETSDSGDSPERSSRLLTAGARRYFEDVSADRERAGFCWDSYWNLAIVRAGGLVAVPATNLIDNIGFDADASHTRRALPGRGLEAVDWPLRHPSEVVLNREIEVYVEGLLTEHVGRLARVLARWLGDGRARRLVSNLVHRRRAARTRAAINRAGVGAQRPGSPSPVPRPAPDPTRKGLAE